MGEAAVGVCGDGGEIVGEEDAVVVGGPLEKVGVGLAAHGRVLDEQDVGGGHSAEEAADNVAIEVFVSEEAKHGYSRGGRAAVRRTRMAARSPWRASTCVRMAAAASVRWARYSRTVAGWRR